MNYSDEIWGFISIMKWWIWIWSMFELLQKQRMFLSITLRSITCDQHHLWHLCDHMFRRWKYNISSNNHIDVLCFHLVNFMLVCLSWLKHQIHNKALLSNCRLCRAISSPYSIRCPRIVSVHPQKINRQSCFVFSWM